MIPPLLAFLYIILLLVDTFEKYCSSVVLAHTYVKIQNVALAQIIVPRFLEHLLCPGSCVRYFPALSIESLTAALQSTAFTPILSPAT